jgi:hypothetical protein
MTKNKANYFFIFLIILVVSLFTGSLLFEQIPYNNGAGFDGSFYREVARDFHSVFNNEGYDSFRIQRIFPFFILNYAFSFLSIETNDQNLLYGITFLHYINLFIQFFFFFKIARLLKWNFSTKFLLFSCLFFNYYTLKNCTYEPFQTDAFAISLSLISYYFILSKKHFLAVVISLLSFITVPLIAYLNLILLLFSNPLNNEAEKNKLPFSGIFTATYLFIITSLFVFVILFKDIRTLQSMLMSNAGFPFFILNGILTAFFIYLLFKKIPKETFPAYTNFFKGFSIKRLLLLLTPFLLLKLFLYTHTNPDFYYNNSSFFIQIVLRPLKYPLVFIVNHITFWGIFPLLVILLFPSFSKNFIKKSLGHSLVFLLFILFSLDSESRHIESFFPFVLMALGYALNPIHFSKKALFTLVSLQLLLSHFYYPINTPHLLEALNQGDFFTFPAQRYFMNFGPWLNSLTYSFWALVSIVSFVLVRWILKKQSK